MRAFISHNVADKPTARQLAGSLRRRGVTVWFDEWRIAPGESIVRGIEAGLSEADTFILIWSAAAAQSGWVGTEWRSFLMNRASAGDVRIVPVLLDETPLPKLIAEYKGLLCASFADIDEVADQIVEIRPSHLGDALGGWLTRLEERVDRGPMPDVVGLGSLTLALGGVERGETYVISGAPGSGKSSLLVTMARHAAKQQFPSTFVALNMSEHQVTHRLACSEARLPMGRAQSGSINDRHWEQIAGALGRIGDASLFVVGHPGASIDTVGRLAEQFSASAGNWRGKFPLLFIDDADLLEGVDGAPLDGWLTAISRDSGCAIIAGITEPSGHAAHGHVRAAGVVRLDRSPARTGPQESLPGLDVEREFSVDSLALSVLSRRGGPGGTVTVLLYPELSLVEVPKEDAPSSS